MKKCLVLLLAMLVIIGSVVPCCHGDDCRQENTDTASAGDNHQEKGTCSPFYTCGSCSGFTQFSKPVMVTVPESCLPAHHEKLVSFFSSAYTTSLFQPPRNS